jgi:hypothetical protein
MGHGPAPRPGPRKSCIALTVTALCIASAAWAQFGRGGDSSLTAHMARPDSFDGRFHYCRAAYRPNPAGDGGGWTTDYPLADIDLSIRLSELTKTPVSFDEHGQPRHLIVRLTDDELFQCPVIIMQEVGTIFLSADDAMRLREYLLKGGFLWVDDFWGSYAWDIFAEQIRKVFPPNEFPIEDVPADHPIFHTSFDLAGVPQIPGIGTWRRRVTSERGADSAQVHTRAISDRHGRVMVFITHNTDVSDSWEREGEDQEYFFRFSVEGYKVAINVLLYAMTH